MCVMCQVDAELTPIELDGDRTNALTFQFLRAYSSHRLSCRTFFDTKCCLCLRTFDGVERTSANDLLSSGLYIDLPAIIRVVADDRE